MQAAPLFSDIARGPEGGVAHWVQTADGQRIRVGHWNADGLKGTVLMFAGRTEYIEKYGDAANEFRKRGYAVVAIDWRGQGLADRMTPIRRMGYVGKFQDYQMDVAALMAHVSALNLPKPYYLVGHSMGGCIGLRALMDGLKVKAVGFSAPMWGISLAAPLRPFAWVSSFIARSIGQGMTFPPQQSAENYVLKEVFEANTLTRDKRMWDIMRAQLQAQPDLALGGPSMHWLNESLREMRRLSTRPSPDVPCLTFLGSAEAIVDPDRIHQRMAKWPGSDLQILQDAEHEVMLEVPATRARVFDGFAAHFDANP